MRIAVAAAALVAGSSLIAGAQDGPVKLGRSCVAADTSIGWDWIRWPRQDSSTPRAALDSLESVLARTPDSAQAPVLLALGRAKAGFFPDDEYARARPDEFFHNEIAGAWMYRGWHFTELRRRFSDSDLVDDAAWEEVALPMGGECEGYVACYVYSVWHRQERFLREFPASPYADSALRLALYAFTIIRHDMDLIHGAEHVEPDEIRKLVAGLDSLARALPPRLGGPLLARAAELWEQLGALENARSAWQAVQTLKDPALNDCVAARLATLPRDVLTAGAPRVVHPRRVELSWRRLEGGAGGYAVYRAAGRGAPETLLGSLPATAVGWIDTSTAPGTSYWYRVAAIRGADSIASFPARADVPSWTVRAEAAAVAGDGRLYIYGRLANGYPQVLQLSPDGLRLERLVAIFLGGHEYGSPWEFEPHLREVFLADANGDGLLRLPMRRAARDSLLRRIVRRGVELVDGTNRDVVGVETLIASVDERHGVAWVGREYGGRERLSALDCLAADSLCWIATDGGLVLRHDDGRQLARLPVQGRGTYSAAIASVHADSMDKSAWAFLRIEKRLVHVDRGGVVKQDVALAGQSGWVNAFNVDFGRRAIWVARTAGRQLELLRMDMNDPELRPHLLATATGNPRWILPDRRGGAWLVSGEDVRHVNAQGRMQVVDALRGALGRH